MVANLRAISGFDGYFCSDMGDIYSRKRGSFRKMKKSLKRTGYESIALSLNGIYRYPLVHRLILRTWSGTANGLECNHKNGIRNDNRLANLEWVTKSQNERHARDVLGKKIHGHHHPCSKLDDAKVVEIRRLRAIGRTYRYIADEFGVAISVVARIANRETWRHI